MSVNKSTPLVSGTAVPVGQTISPSYPVAEPVQAFAVQPVQAQPAVTASVMATNITIGPQDQVKLIDATTASILASVNSFTIKQRVKWWEAISQGCCEQANVYDIFDKQTGAHLFIAQEESDPCCRCCCAPHHSVRVDFKLVNAASRVWRSDAAPTVMSMERLGCCAKPFLGCFICHDSCKDGFYLQAGATVRQPGEVGIDSRTIGIATQPSCGGCFTPSINLMQRTQPGDGYEAFKPMAKIEGPCIFGGASELCCPSKFLVSGMTEDMDGNQKLNIGDLATITKEKPRNCSGCAREAFTDSDHFTVEYKEGVGLTPQQKATMMAGLLLADYMLFEQDNGMCEYTGNGLAFTFFDCYCCGCVVPCQVTFSNNNGGGGD